MKRIADSITNVQTKNYFKDVTNGKRPGGNISADEYMEGVGQMIESMDSVLADAKNEVARQRLGEIPRIISFSYIAKKYFGKSRGWIMQKVNGNTVNGKQAAFSDDERQQFRAALEDISRQLSAAAQSF